MSKEFRIVAGLFLLILVVILLAVSPGEIFTRGVYLIDTELKGSSGNEKFVRTTVDFGSAEKLETILLDNTEWTGFPFDMSKVQGQLGAEILVTWGCRHPSSYHTIWFLILQSKDVVSFHPPPVCYRALGYEIESEDAIEIEVSGEGWATEVFMEAIDDPNIYQGTIGVKKLVVLKEGGNEPSDKRLVLYYYIKNGGSTLPNEVTMIRVSAQIPVQGSYDEVLELQKKIVADFFPLMFEPRPEERTFGKWLIDEGGVLGGCAIAAMLMLPVGFLIYPVVRTSKFWCVKSKTP